MHGYCFRTEFCAFWATLDVSPTFYAVVELDSQRKRERGQYALVMAKSHEHILRRITRRFCTFPSKTYSNRILSDVNVLINYEKL